MLAAVQLQPYAELIVVGYISEFANSETLGVESSLERGSAPIAMIRDKTHEDSRYIFFSVRIQIYFGICYQCSLSS